VSFQASQGNLATLVLIEHDRAFVALLVGHSDPTAVLQRITLIVVDAVQRETRTMR
jgi:hypothetical protein